MQPEQGVLDDLLRAAGVAGQQQRGQAHHRPPLAVEDGLEVVGGLRARPASAPGSLLLRGPHCSHARGPRRLTRVQRRYAGPDAPDTVLRMAEECVFCRIVAGELPVELLHDDEHVVAFRDMAPKAEVHVLVVPRRHVARRHRA